MSIELLDIYYVPMTKIWKKKTYPMDKWNEKRDFYCDGNIQIAVKLDFLCN